MKFYFSLKNVLYLFLCITMLSCQKQQPVSGSVKNVVDNVVTRLYKDLNEKQLDTLSDRYIMTFLTKEEKEVLATKFWTFDVNVPATVSLMRDTAQSVVPFWITERGFKKTGMIVKNEEYTYEVWQKDFDKGKVELGINGFDKHRPVYFISVGAQKKGDDLKITNVYPSEFRLMTMKQGAFTYHDWDGLILTQVPAELSGQVLFTTVRGRAREAHLVSAFRKTQTPSSAIPDQVLLTFSGDPKTTMNIQWRADKAVEEGIVKYWQEQGGDTLTVKGTGFKMEDRLLQNDRFVNRFTARLDKLQPGTKYFYKVGATSGKWSPVADFRTEPANNNGFSFIWFGDTHKSQIWGDMAQKSLKRHPEIAFYDIAGDLVSTGLNRDEWDELWQHSGNVFSYKPLMAVPGNHDSQDGLGAGMYQEMFSLPENGPKGFPKEMTYAFNYQDALFVMIDATLSVPGQTAWLEEKLRTSNAKWKFVFFHFPPYNFVEPYDEIRKEWGTLFDKYHVDMVMSGHMHYYLRTKPMNNGKAMASPAQGTIYTMSISIPGKQEEWLPEDYAVKRYPDGPLYQHISMKGNTLIYKCYNPEGEVKDSFEIVK
jgi:predicted phosphodiesterase